MTTFLVSRSIQRMYRDLIKKKLKTRTLNGILMAWEGSLRDTIFNLSRKKNGRVINK